MCKDVLILPMRLASLLACVSQLVNISHHKTHLELYWYKILLKRVGAAVA